MNGWLSELACHVCNKMLWRITKGEFAWWHCVDCDSPA